MSLEDYILEDEQVLSTLSFRGVLTPTLSSWGGPTFRGRLTPTLSSLGRLTKVVATNRRVIRYEAESEKEAFLDLPYETIVSIETTFERISHYGIATAGGILLAIDLAVLAALPGGVVPSWLYAIWAIVSFALIGLGFLKETRLSLRFLGEGIPEREKQWVFSVDALHGKPENLPQFTKVVRQQLSK